MALATAENREATWNQRFARRLACRAESQREDCSATGQPGMRRDRPDQRETNARFGCADLADVESGGRAAPFRGAIGMAVALQVAVQAGASNAQNLGGAQAIALTHVQYALNVNFPHVV